MSHGDLHSRVSRRRPMGGGYEGGGCWETTPGDVKGNRLRGHCGLAGGSGRSAPSLYAAVMA